MEIIEYPEVKDWNKIAVRPQIDLTSLYSTVNSVLEDIKANGDSAVREYEQKFDHVELQDLRVSDEEIAEAIKDVDAELLSAIRLAHDNIYSDFKVCMLRRSLV